MYYIYDSRFQPFNNENLAELQWLIDNIESKDKIIIGIINPTPLKPDESDLPSIWPRFRKEFNPLTYWQRHQTIKMVIDDIGCGDRISGIIPMPRPSVNMKSADNFLPPKSERKICVPLVLNDALENTKIEGLNNQNEEHFVIPAYKFDPKLRIVSPELITCLIALGYSDWDMFVPDIIKPYLRSTQIESIVSENLIYYKAKQTLTVVYSQMKENLQNEMQKHFSEYLNNTQSSQSPQRPLPTPN